MITTPSPMQPLRLGILGMSEGNGHPYSWAAIFNGFDADEMAHCPFPAIPSYLSRQRYPEDFLTAAKVTHVWTQDRAISNHIAAAARIETVVDTPEAMIGQVDAILLARDDAQNHLRFAELFLHAGVPIYIDKPLAISRRDAETLLGLVRPDATLFSCSALRYAPELIPSEAQLAVCGRIRFIDAVVPSKWATYAVHAIEPVLSHIVGEHDMIKAAQSQRFGAIVQLVVTWKSGLITRFSSLGAGTAPIGFTLYGEKANMPFVFRDSFYAFRAALDHFVDVVRGQRANIPRGSTLAVVDLIELGNRS